MQQATPEEIIEMLEGLAEGEEFDTSRVLEFLSHDDPAVREAAVWALWNGELTRIADPLVERVEHDPDALVQSAAVSVLGRFVYEGLMLEESSRGTAEARIVEQVNTYLLEIFHDPQRSELLRRRALESLAFNPTKEILATIEEWAGSPDEMFRKSAAFAMGRVSEARFAALLLKLLDDPSQRVQIEAIRSIGEQGIRKGTPRLLALARDGGGEVAWEAVEALGQVGGTRAIQALQTLSGHDNPELAELAVAVLRDLKGE